MLIFFIHGVATQNVKYAQPLESLIREEFKKRGKFKTDDAAFKIRAMIEGLGSSHESRKVYLSSITTMGSPILLFNMMLGTNPEKVKSFADTYPENNPLRWINIIHSSDIIAYPLRSSLDIDSSDNLLFEDKYIQDDANQIERNLRDFANSKNKVVQAIGLVNPLINEAVALAPMFAGAGEGHIQYWNNHRTASLIAINVLREKIIKLRLKIINQVINHLKQVPGMTCPWTPSLRLNLLTETLEEINFKDGSGKLILCVNPLQVHHVYVFDRYDNCKFRGYVGLIHGDGLKQSVDLIKKNYC